MNYWVVDTDYENYALVYGCNRVQRGTGRCSSAYSWILERTRKPGLSQELRRRIDGKITELCLRSDRFQNVSQTGESKLKFRSSFVKSCSFSACSVKQDVSVSKRSFVQCIIFRKKTG